MRRRILAACIASIACGESSSTPPMDGSGSTSVSEETTGLSTSSGPAETSVGADSTGDVATMTGSESSSGTTSTFPIPVCGDGIVEGDEECDDQNRDPHDGCDGLCNLSGIVEWTVVFDGPDSGNDVAQAVAVAPGGDLWVAGTIGGAQQAVRLRRYDPSGRFVAEIDLASDTSDDVRGLAIDDQGALYVAGSSLGLGVDEAWVVKLDSAGSEEWRYSRAATVDTASVAARDVALGASAIYMVGVEERTTKAVDLDAWVVAMDADGVPQWEHPYPGEPGEDAFAGGVAVAPDGTIVVVGVESRPGQAFDGWVRKIDPAGAEQWTVTEIGAGVASEETLRAVAIAGDGGIVVTGLLDALDGEHLFTREYDPSGATLWTRTYAGPDGTTRGGRAVAIGSRGDVVITGSVGIVGQSNDVIVRRYSDGGDLELWTSYYNDARTNLDDFGHAVAVAPDGSVYAAGETLVSGQGRDWWISKYAGR